MARSAVAAGWSTLRGRIPWIASNKADRQQGDEEQEQQYRDAVPMLRVSTGTKWAWPRRSGQDADCEPTCSAATGIRRRWRRTKRQQRKQKDGREAEEFQPTRVKSMTIAPGSRCRYSMVMPSP